MCISETSMLTLTYCLSVRPLVRLWAQVCVCEASSQMLNLLCFYEASIQMLSSCVSMSSLGTWSAHVSLCSL